MATAYHGTFVIPWAQTEIDGLPAAPVEALASGAVWSWRGDALRVDGPGDVLQLAMADEPAELRRRAGRKVRRLIGPAAVRRGAVAEAGEAPGDTGFTVTNGACSYAVTLIPQGHGLPLLGFEGERPPRDSELWVVEVRRDCRQEARARAEADRTGLICFTPGTRIRTPRGSVPVEMLREGSLVQTRDAGPQPVLWTGSRRMTGARLHAMPWLRPVRIRAGAFGIARPEAALLVSPEHRLLVRGARARALFNTEEVLVAARDLIRDGGAIARDSLLREVTYIHLLLPSHQILWANGVETESFHPANATLDALSLADRRRLLAGLPGIAADPFSYGGFARRNLTPPEAAILRHEAA
ncbi:MULTISPECIES: Hint domain-containing protein [Pseudooceanicola]|uniref:Hint domain-containing protein n=1 Tax=Pseudooceanicola TaxID=1679449 RepID=UPI004059798D